MESVNVKITLEHCKYQVKLCVSGCDFTVGIWTYVGCATYVILGKFD